MPDVIDQLRAYGDAVEAAVPAAEVTEPRSRRPLLLAAAAVVLLACIGAAVWALRADDGSATDPIEQPEVPVGWHRLDPGPLAPREGSALVWTGEELVVWGGDGHADGAAFAVDSGEWRPMSDSPLRPGRSVGVWTGGEVLLWSVGEIEYRGGHRLTGWTGAAWDPATDEWRELAGRCFTPSRPVECPSELDLGLTELDPVWAGDEMVDVAVGAAYDPATDQWRELPDRPVQGPVLATVWTGEDVVTLVANRSDAGLPAGEAVGLSYDPATDRWAVLPPTGVAELPAELVWDGERAVAVSHDLRTSAFDPTSGAWTPLPAMALPDHECVPRAAAVGDTVLADQCAGQALLTESGDWALAPEPPLPVGTLVGAGDQVLSWWSTDDAANFLDAPVTHFSAFGPPELAEGDLALERTVPVGGVRLDLPDGARLVAAERVEELGGLVEHLRFELGSPDCRLDATQSSVGASAQRIRNDVSGLDARFSHVDLSQEGLAHRALVAHLEPGQVDDRAHALVATTTSTVLDIACPDPATAEDLVTRLHP